MLFQICIASFISRVVTEDVLPKGLLQRPRDIGPTLKPWTKYSDMFLEQKIKLLALEIFSMSNLLSVANSKAAAFLANAKREIQLKDFIRLSKIVSPIVIMNIRRARFPGSALVFRIAKGLSLNLTFSSIKVFSHCHENYRNQFLVQSVIGKGLSVLFKFCGIHSNTTLFPPANTVIIEYVNKAGAGEIKGIIAVMSPDVIVSKTRENSKSHFLGGFHILKGNLFVYTFRIYTEKDKQLYLNLCLEFIQFLIFDGPGIKSNVVTGAKTNFVCSTFQCILQATTKQANDTLTTNDIVTFYGKRRQVQQFNFSTKLHLKFPKEDSDLNPWFEVFEVKLQNNKSLNVTVLNFYLEGEQSMICLFGGVVVMEPFATTHSPFRETFSLCNKGTHENSFILHQAQSIFVGSMTKLIVYSYKMYTKLQLIFTLGHTRCRTIQIHPCEFEELKLPLDSFACFLVHISTNKHVKVQTWRKKSCSLWLKTQRIEGREQTFEILTSWFHQKPVGSRISERVVFQLQQQIQKFHHWALEPQDKIIVVFEEQNEVGILHQEQYLWQVPSFREGTIYFVIHQFSHQFVQIITQKINTKTNSCSVVALEQSVLHFGMMFENTFDLLLIEKISSRAHRSYVKFVSPMTLEANHVLLFSGKMSLVHSFHQKRSSFLLSLLGSFKNPQISLLNAENQNSESFLFRRLSMVFPETEHILYEARDYFMQKSYSDRYFAVKYTETRQYNFVQYFVKRLTTSCYFVMPTKEQGKQGISWNDANHECRNAGQKLPEFHSRREQEEFIAMLKRNPTIFIDALFITWR